MRWRPWRKPRPPVHDPKPAREAAEALAEAQARWAPVHEVVAAHKRMRLENHLGVRVARALQDER